MSPRTHRYSAALKLPSHPQSGVDIAGELLLLHSRHRLLPVLLHASWQPLLPQFLRH